MKNKVIFNPHKDDFSITYDINGDSNPVEYTIQALSSGEFPEVVADHITEHLAKKIAFEEGWKKSNFEDKFKEVTERIQGGF